MADWSELHEDLLRHITDKLHSIEDLIKFAGVCRPWRSIGLDTSSSFLNRCPWLMHPVKKNKEKKLFFNPSEDKIHIFHLPEMCERRYWGTPYGWLLILTSHKRNPYLLNPLTHSRILLPRKSKTMGSIVKATLTIPNFPHQNVPFVVWATCGNKLSLAFTRQGDKAWTAIENSYQCRDIISFNGKFYSVDRQGALWLTDISTPKPQVVNIASPVKDHLDFYCTYYYLVELCGELHMIRRCYNGRGAWFEVFKLDMCTYKWGEVQSLGNYAVFIGNNASFARMVIGEPKLKCNCIYFTDENFSNDCNYAPDRGTFDLETKMLQPLPTSSCANAVFAPSIGVWIVPKLTNTL